MKLRNRKTGEIVEATDFNIISDYNSLAELNSEWEDYEEPKEYWRITDLGEIKSIRLDQHHQNIEKCKAIGNYFETEEEAEKAVEKLKAWKRLKDKGFRFDGKTLDTSKRFGSIFYWLDKNAYSEDYIDDLDLLFGGEE